MTTLKNLQFHFIQNVLNETDHTHQVVQSVIDPNRLIFPERLSIYKHNYKMCLIKTLCETYAVCYKLIGRRAFEFLARHYIRENPSSQNNLNYYGELFSQFILNFEPAKNIIYLADVAQLEWLVHEVLIGEDEKNFCWQALENVPIEKQGNICFYRFKNSRIMNSHYPIDRIFEMNQPDNLNETIIHINDNKKEMIHLYIGREDYDLKIQQLTAIEYDVLNILYQKITLAELSDHPFILENKVDIALLLPSLIQKNCLAGFYILH